MLAIGALWETHHDALRLSAETAAPPRVRPSRPAAAARLCAGLVVYAGWQALIGALFGLAAFAVFGAALLGIALISH
jgi:hypothetical protein